MADNNLYNSNDSMDISELASLNEDISPELIEQLQQKLSKEAEIMQTENEASNKAQFNVYDDTTLFEETNSNNKQPEKVEKEEKTLENKTNTNESQASSNEQKKNLNLEKNFDDNFLKKYKAKLYKQNSNDKSSKSSKAAEDSISNVAFTNNVPEQQQNIEEISKGNITERKITQAQKNYNDSLDFLDGNIKYSKYVIYIDPQNVDFIDSLTVKERKNLINRILREQDDIAITKQRFKILNTIIKHAVVAILTITISIPIIYWTINASLEATINSYRQSQTMFQSLYRENGKITNFKK